MEVRSIWTSTELRGYLDFPYAAQVFTLRREVTEMVSQKCRTETVQGLSSLPAERATPARLLALSRGQWTIENRLHWVRDVTFDEDRSRVRKGAGAQVMASIRNLAISLLRIAGARYIAPALRRCARSDPQALRLIGLRL
ncbi:MAG: transposase [Terriglobia bacterium]